MRFTTQHFPSKNPSNFYFLSSTTLLPTFNCKGLIPDTNGRSSGCFSSSLFFPGHHISSPFYWFLLKENRRGSPNNQLRAGGRCVAARRCGAGGGE